MILDWFITNSAVLVGVAGGIACFGVGLTYIFFYVKQNRSFISLKLKLINIRFYHWNKQMYVIVDKSKELPKKTRNKLYNIIMVII